MQKLPRMCRVQSSVAYAGADGLNRSEKDRNGGERVRGRETSVENGGVVRHLVLQQSKVDCGGGGEEWHCSHCCVVPTYLGRTETTEGGKAEIEQT